MNVADEPHLFRCYTTTVIVCSVVNWRLYVSAFGLGVTLVVEIRSQEQVRRVGTGSIVAVMEDVHSLGDRAKVNHPRHAVCLDKVTLPTPVAKHAITAVNGGSNPTPTSFFCDENVTPKALKQWTALSCSGAT
jgi:hypothetical protein